MSYWKGIGRGALGTVLWTVVLGFLISIFAIASPVSASDLGLTEADCRCCHGTTLADRHHLLVNSAGLECLSCHQTVLNQGTMEFEVSLVRDCLQCHTGSLADRHHVLVNQEGFDCFSCHAMVFDPVTMQYVADFNVRCETNEPAPSVAPGSVNGTVSTAAGTALAWARVATRDGSASALTTAAGSFQLPDLPAGDYLLDVALDGYAATSRTVSVVSGQSTLADFTLNPLVAPGTISGKVLDLNLVPINGARVFVEGETYSSVSGPDGAYSLVDVAEGAYLLVVEKNGYETLNQSVSLAGGQVLTEDLVLIERPVEICGDGLDNDGNGLVDCLDAVCADTAGCQPLAVEICDDGIDNDGNSLVDCLDSACAQSPVCPPPVVEICDDGIDNDGNGLGDCSDPACMGHGSCLQPAIEICDDGLDNDANGMLDCADPFCSSAAHCLPEVCGDGVDNDANGLIDCADSACVDTSRCLPPPVEICDDGLDNDANGLIDCADEKCAGHSLCAQPVPPEFCSNGIDDNNDGLRDCADPQCAGRSACLVEICGNDLDDDRDGQSDCADPDCAEDSSCFDNGGKLSLASARTSEYKDHYYASGAIDGNMATRWWADKDDDEWLRVDLGGIFDVARVVIHWHREYAEEYKVKLSKDGRNWTTVEEVDEGDGGLDVVEFGRREARYLLIDCEKAREDGFSIYELEVWPPDAAGAMGASEICEDDIDNDGDGRIDCADTDCGENPVCTARSSSEPATPANQNLALHASTRSSESRDHYYASRAVDGDMATRWWVDRDKDQWIRVDLGSVHRVGRIVISWHSEYAEDYQVKVSRDNDHWTRVMEVEHADGGRDSISFPARDARYVLIDCKEARADGFSIYELEVYPQ